MRFYSSRSAIMPICKYMFLRAIATLLVLLISVCAGAGNKSAITYQGRILNPNGTPINAILNFRFVIRAPTNCVLWAEEQVIDLRNSGGAFSARIGEGTNIATGTHGFSSVFSNASNVNSLTECDLGNVYSPALNDDRSLIVSFNDGSGSQVLPVIPIKSVPFANESASTMALRGIKISPTLPTNNQVLRYDSVLDQWVPQTLAAGGSVTNVDLSFAGGIFNVAGGPITNQGTFDVTLASQSQNRVFAAPVGSSGAPSFRLLDVSDIPFLDAAKISSGTLSAAVGGTGLVPSVVQSNKIYAVNAAGNGTEFKSLMAGTNVTLDYSVPGQITVNSAASGGTVTQITAGLGLNGGVINNSGTISLNDTSVTPGTYGATNYSTTFTVDQQGRLTGAGSTVIAINANQITAGTLNYSTLGDLTFGNLSGTISLAQRGPVDGSSLSNIAGTSITSGTINWAILASLPASQLVGTLNTAQVGMISNSNLSDLAASKLTGTLNISTLGDLTFGNLSGTISLAQRGPVDGSSLSNIAGTSITSGTINWAILASLPSSQLVGTLNAAQVGVISNSNLSDLAASKLTGTLNHSTLGDLTFGNLSGTISLAQRGAIDGSSLSNIAGTSITSGTINWAILASLPSSQLAGTINTSVLGSLPTTSLFGTLNTAQVGVISNSNLSDFAASKLTGTLNYSTLGDLTFGNLSGTISLAQRGPVDGSSLSNIAGTSITSGTINWAILASLPSSQLVGTLNTAQVGVISNSNLSDLAASKLFGTLNTAQVGMISNSNLSDLAASKLTGTLNFSTLGDLTFGNLSGTISHAQRGAIDGSSLTNIAGTSITSGTINWAILASLPSSQLAGTTNTSVLGSLPTTSLFGTLNTAQVGMINNSNLSDLAASKLTGTLNYSTLGDLNFGNLSGTISLAQRGAIDGSSLTNIAGTSITSGTINWAILASLPASQLVGTLNTAQTGMIGNANLSDLAASKLFGTLNSAQVGMISNSNLSDFAASKLTGTLNYSTLGDLTFGNLSGTISLAQRGAIDGSSLTNIAGTSITSGTINWAILATLPASQLVGTINTSVLGSLPTSSLFGTINTAQVGMISNSNLSDLAASKLTGTLNYSTIGDLTFGNLSGTISLAQRGPVDGSSLSNIAGTSITTGTINWAILASLPSSQLAGTINTSVLGSLPTSSLFGTINTAQVGVISNSNLSDLAASKLTGTLNYSTLGDLTFGNLSGTISLAQRGAIDGSSLTNIAGTSITTGTINWAILASLPSSQLAGTINTSVLGNLPFTSLFGTINIAQVGVISNSNLSDLAASKLTGTLNYSTLGDLTFGNLSGTISLAQRGAIDGSSLTNIAGTSITSGTINWAILATLPASQLVGTINTSVLGSLPTTSLFGTINTAQVGVINNANLSDLAASKLTGTLNISTLGDLTFGNLSGTISLAQRGAIDGSSLSNIAGTSITSGTINWAILASLPSSQLVGTINTSVLGNLPFTSLFGTINTAQVGMINNSSLVDLAASKLTGTLNISTLGDLTFGNLSGTISQAQLGSISSSQWTSVPEGINFPAGSVGIGSATPYATLDVNGGIKVGTSVTCDSNRNGTLRYTGGGYQFCDGTSWQPFAGVTSSFRSLNTTVINNVAKSSSTTYSADLSPYVGANSALVLIRFRTSGATTVWTWPADLGSNNWADGSSSCSIGANFFCTFTLRTDSSGIINYEVNNNTNVTMVLLGYLATAPSSSSQWIDGASSSISYSSGSVGVGTTAPLALLDINGEFRSSSSILASGGTVTMLPPLSGTTAIRFPSNAGSPGQVLSTDGTGNLSWITSSGGGVTYPLLSTTLGSVGSPVFSFSSDPDTGIYSPGTGTLAFSTNGANRINIDSAGNIGVGTLFPAAIMEIAQTSTTGNSVLEALRISHADSNTAGANGLGTKIVFTGESNSNGVLPETGVIESVLDDAANASKDSSLRFYTLGPNSAAGVNTATEKLRIGSGSIAISSATFQAPAEAMQNSVNSGASVALGALTAGNIYRVTLTADTTITLPADPGISSGVANIVLIVTQDGTGSRNITFASPTGSIQWDLGSVPTACGNAGSKSIFQFIKINGDNDYYGSLSWKACP